MTKALPSPRYEVSVAKLRRNLELLADIRDRGQCQIVLAQKGFSLWHTYPIISDYLDGCCASGLWEARLAHEEMGKHVLTYSPAYAAETIPELCDISTHLDFNSLSQWDAFKSQIIAHPRYLSGDLRCGLRINPEHSTGATPLYDPCSSGSRLGITADQLENADLSGISTLHFHTLCEQGFDDLSSTMDAVEEKFGHLLRSDTITELNLGGGHWLTKPDYNREGLIVFLKEIRERYSLEALWLEPGEAVAIHTGILVSTVLDIVRNGDTEIAILDVSATGHMPDVLEMPYRPDVLESSEKGLTYQLGCPTCLAGDVIGKYAFPRPLKIGDTITFDDMAHYTMVKTTTFNGVQHPAIVLDHEDGKKEIVREFTYEDFKARLG